MFAKKFVIFHVVAQSLFVKEFSTVVAHLPFAKRFFAEVIRSLLLTISAVFRIPMDIATSSHDDVVLGLGIDLARYHEILQGCDLPRGLAGKRIEDGGSLCRQSFPCKHTVRIAGQDAHVLLNAVEICKMCALNPACRVDIAHMARQVMELGGRLRCRK